MPRTLHSLVTPLGHSITVSRMKSPFPGMDPYLERDWEDVHGRLIVYAGDTLQPHLPDDLLVRVEQRVFVESDAARIRADRAGCAHCCGLSRARRATGVRAA